MSDTDTGTDTDTDTFRDRERETGRVPEDKSLSEILREAQRLEQNGEIDLDLDLLVVDDYPGFYYVFFGTEEDYNEIE